MKVLALIPARGGSKGIPRKNLVELGGKPLLAWTIAAACEALSIDRVIVSTDDSEIAIIARKYGAETPFVRPYEYAGDSSSALGVIKHAIKFLTKEEGWRPDCVVYLQPTSPFRNAKNIDDAVAILKANDVDTIVSVEDMPHNMLPQSLMVSRNGRLDFYQNRDEQIFRRQDKRVNLFARNGPAVLLNRTEVIETGKLYGDKIAPLKMGRLESLDIDEPLDVDIARQLLPLILKQ